VTLLIFTLGWKLVAWLGAKVVHVNFGWRSPLALPILAAGVFICGAFAVISTVRWMRTWQDMRPLVSGDLSRGVVVEDLIEPIAAKRFQEEEHGGLIYFLHTKDNRVFVLFDHESQDLGVYGKDPLASSLRPQTEYRIVRAPTSRFILSRVFSGRSLPLGKPLPLVVPPKQWPECDEFCDIPWGDLELRLGSTG
jgi:hypothetical protein